jgi:hypothetical protein
MNDAVRSFDIGVDDKHIIHSNPIPRRDDNGLPLQRVGMRNRSHRSGRHLSGDNMVLEYIAQEHRILEEAFERALGDGKDAR